MVEGTQKQFARTSHLAPWWKGPKNFARTSHLAPWWKGPKNFARTSHLGGRDQRTLLAPRTLVEGTKELCSHLTPRTLHLGGRYQRTLLAPRTLHLAPWWKGPKNFARTLHLAPCTLHLGGRDKRTLLAPCTSHLGGRYRRTLLAPRTLVEGTKELGCYGQNSIFLVMADIGHYGNHHEMKD